MGNAQIERFGETARPLGATRAKPRSRLSWQRSRERSRAEKSGQDTVTRAAQIIVAAACCLVAASPLPTFPQMRAEDTGLPQDVTDLINRRVSCDDYIARGRLDPTFASGIAPVLINLRCSDVPDEENALRDRYRHDPHVMAALDAKWTKVVRRVPVPPAAKQDSTPAYLQTT